ncbi:MAG TPA: asparagine synthase (glutamine-hydrolyzing) [Flavobacteriales bacterium]|nr:asparagine synthase (glutamine-hydrolyzing) [Flavobacteriales bacterium]HIO68052.1 asparagine synthase (glutamine-hydrolyzing) [Flavobacteriales bacterium]
MCGIAGFYTKSDLDRGATIGSMLDVMAYRGPDDRNTADIDQVTFGHLRLSIIDLANGKQPMVSPDGRYTLIFNGEIYNYVELKQELVGKGHAISTSSDTEVLLHMYMEYGAEMLDQLNGMFALAIYDKQDKELFVARDHFGVKPFYFHQSEGVFVFASEIKSLLQFPGVKAEVDQKSLYEYLTFQMVLNRHTLFQNIQKLNPASYLIIKDGKVVEKKRYWDVNFTIDTETKEEDYADELLSLIEDSISIQTRSDVPFGAHLSGGLDSSIVSTLACKYQDGEFKTFTGGFKEDKIYDETNYARLVSDAIGSKHYEIFPTSTDFAGLFEKLVYHMDEPAAGPGLFPQYMVSKLASEEVKVVLGGQGGDEVFGGYARYAVAYLEQCLKGAIFETQEEGQHVVTLSSIIPHMSVLKEYTPMIKDQFKSGMFDAMDKRYYNLIDRSPNLDLIFSKELLSERDEDDIFNKFSSIFNHPDTVSYFNKMTHYDMRTLLPALLHVEDRVSMAVSLESRVPLLDKRLIELAAKMPPTMKFAGGKTKYMLLKAVKDIVPKEIIDRKDKMGFPTPFNDWIAGPLKEYALDLLTGSTAKNRGIYNTKNIENHIVSGNKFSRGLWGAMNLETWYRKFID